MGDLNIPELNALLEEQLRVLGPDHPDTLMTRHILARKIFHEGYEKEAYSLYDELVRDRSRVLGADHPDTFSSRHNRALCRAHSGDAVGAIAEFAELISDMQDALGMNDLHVFHTRQQYAVVMDMAGLTEEAISQWNALLQDLRDEHRQNFRLVRETNRLVGRAQKSLKQSEDDSVGDEIAEPPDEPEEPKTAEIKLGRALAQVASGILGREPSQVAMTLAEDARYIAEKLNGGLDPKISSAILGNLGVEPGRQGAGEFLQIIRDLAQSPDPTAGRVGSQIGLAYAEIAHMAARLDLKWDDHESKAIDELRLQVRELLGPRLDTTSDAALEFERKFEDIVGLEVVKEKLLAFVNVLLRNKRDAQRGGEEHHPRLHLAFTGNPGTGKTTVARMYGELLNSLGLLPRNKFTEVDKSGLVAQYTGQTEAKTSAVIERADPGVLFIDEAYALNDRERDQKGFGEMALEILIKRMEDSRETLVVVLAGYSKEMDELMNLNPGLRSRLADIIEFPDYTVDELLEIARRVLNKRQYRLGEGVEEKITQMISEMRNRPNFGNARDIENLIDEIVRNQSLRLSPLDDLATEDERRLLTVVDVPDVPPVIPARKIGFA